MFELWSRPQKANPSRCRLRFLPEVFRFVAFASTHLLALRNLRHRPEFEVELFRTSKNLPLKERKVPQTPKLFSFFKSFQFQFEISTEKLRKSILDFIWKIFIRDKFGEIILKSFFSFFLIDKVRGSWCETIEMVSKRWWLGD